MERFTILVWNLEQFGTKFGNVANVEAAQAAELLRCQLITAIAAANGAQVIVIQELRKSGILVLPALISYLAKGLGGTWHFDWLPGAITANVDTVTSFEDLGFDPVANSEGYAVVWREGALSAFTDAPLSAGVDSTTFEQGNGHYISLISRGRNLVFDSESDVPITFGDNTGELGFPPSTCPDVGSVITTRSSSHSANDVIESRTRVRRPCVVQLAPVETPLVVYHAPVGQNSSRSDYYGTLIGFASDYLQGDSVIFAGDFNVVSAPAQTALRSHSTELGYDLSTYIQQGSTGPVVPAPSVVHYVNHHGDQFRTGSQVFGSGRDYGFVRKHGKSVSMIVYDALEALRTLLFTDGTANQLGIAVSQMFDHFTRVVDDLRIADVVQEYLSGKTLSGKVDARTAQAIIYRELVSDHLPVAIRYRI